MHKGREQNGTAAVYFEFRVLVGVCRPVGVKGSTGQLKLSVDV